MANVFSSSIKRLYIKGLSIKHAIKHFCLFVFCALNLLLSSFNIVILPPLSIFVVLMLLLSPNTTFAQNHLLLPTAEKPVDILEFKNHIFLVTEHTVYQADKKELHPVFHSESLIKAAAATKNLFCLATEEGLLATHSQINTNQLLFKKRQLPTDKTDFIALRADPTTAQMWVATRGNGIYIVNDSTENLVIKALFVNDLAVVSAADYWLGTDAGLVHRVADQTIRYAEEGVAGFEIPDNIVEKLHIINGEKLIVQMSIPLSIFHLAGEKTAAHGVNLGFIGTKGNVIFDLQGLPNGAVLAATAAGLTYLPQHILADNHEHEGFHEIFTEADRREATKLEWTDVGFKTVQPNTLIKKLFMDSRQNIWLAADGQLLQMKAKKLLAKKR